MCGEWRLERSVSDASRGAGSAHIERLSEFRCRLHEFVTMMLMNGETVSGSRDYLLQEVGEHLIFRFNDGENAGEVFQTFASGKLCSSSTHLCGRDVYESTLTWCGDDVFELVHVVNGPKKDYEMRSRYLRAGKPN